MDTNIRYGASAIGVLILLVVGAWLVYATKGNPSTKGNPLGTIATSTPSVSTATSSTSTPPGNEPKTTKPAMTQKTASYQFALVSGDAVASWNFTGSYKDGGTLEAQANAQVARLKGLLDSGTYTNYELYVSIANQYDLLGDGKNEYTYLNDALAIDSTKTGLAWHNMGTLLARLGAVKSARIAYDRMVTAQPTAQYIRARLEFLQAHMPEDTDAITQAQADLSAAGW